MKQLFNKKNTYIFIAILLFGLFAYITYCTPLAGDDWGYCLNGLKGNPIKTAIEFYSSWSGRFFSELWGFIVPCRKWLWNILNPLLFFLIYIFTYKLGDIKHKPLSNALLVAVLMLTVEEGIRMQTYTWIMGTTYVVPLCLSLIYFYTIDKAFKAEKINRSILLLNNLLLLVAGLMMENISATLVGSILFIAIYAFFNKRELFKYLIINFIISLAAFAIMRLSPGSAFRTMRDHTVWMEMSLFEKIITAYPNFLKITFINNRYLIVVLSGVLLGLCLFAKKKSFIKIPSILVYFLAVFSMLSYYLHLGNNPFINENSVFSFVFWPVFVVTILADLFIIIEDSYDKAKAIILFIVGGTCALIMLYSPIYGSRSALYTVYYLMVLIIFIYDRYDLPWKYLNIILIAGMLGLCCLRGLSYIKKYNLVKEAQKEREELITYYREHPEDEEVWLPRFPINTIHSIDIEPDDTYHLETFKEYYQLPQDASNIFFYAK